MSITASHIIGRNEVSIIRYLVALGFSLAALIFQHLIHELSHVLAARLCGEKVIRVQWLTYHGGTRVFYENEPDPGSEETNKKWMLIAGSGFITTTILGYLFTVLYFVVANGLLKAILCYFSVIFLVVDSLYFFIGSIGNFGDVTGVRKMARISRRLSILLCIAILAIHLAIIIRCFYLPL